MKKNAFTLAELLIVMGIIGFVAIIVLSQTKTIVPNESMTMFKKAYSVTTQIVNSMVDDDDLYPELNENGNAKDGFDNTDAVIYKIEERSGNTKFCWLFGEMLNTSSDISCDDGSKTFTEGVASNGHFTTTDGIEWILPVTSFDNSDATSIDINGTTHKVYPIYVDINGEEGPNCFADDTKCNCESETQNTDGSRQCNLPEPDRMIIYITTDGSVLLKEKGAEEFYVKSEKPSAKYHAKDKTQ